ncbi:MAG: nucleotidyltransferase domain-containing protein [Coriobacteriia bacterium]
MAVLSAIGAESTLGEEPRGTHHPLLSSQVAFEQSAVYSDARSRHAVQDTGPTYAGGIGDRLFASAALRAVMSLFVLNPDQVFYQREVARRADVSLRSAQLALKRLVDLGFVSATRSGNRMYYSVLPSRAFDALREWAIPEIALVPVLRESLESLSGLVEMAFVYGSAATGEDTATSDIDLMIVGTADSAELYAAVRGAEARLGRDVNITHYDPEEFLSKIAHGAHFVTSVIRSPLIWLLGRESSGDYGIE